jgi:hypothetical protein
MDTAVADVTIHIDENLELAKRGEVDSRLRAIDGVVSVHNSADRPHLTVVKYDPQKVRALGLLDSVKSLGVHAELIGL